MYFNEDDLFLVMERIHGSTLAELWDDMSSDDKMSITGSLRTIFDQIRQALHPSPTFFGSVDHGPVPHHLFWDRDNNPKICGPFDSENTFNCALLAQYKEIKEYNQMPLFKHHFYSSHLDDALAGHKATLTHGDVQSKNIIVTDQNQDTPQKLRSYRMALVDWEDAGWYPEYWEYFAAFTAFQWIDDWPSKLEDFIGAYAPETAMMAMIYRELHFGSPEYIGLCTRCIAASGSVKKSVAKPWFL